MKTKHLILFAFCIILSLFSFSQGVAINTDGSNADASAILDISSTNGGVLIPRMTTAEITSISNPATGLMLYQTDGIPGIYYNSGTSASPVWTKVIISSDSYNLLTDADNDTKIQVEESSDEDIIRLDIAGTEKWVFTQNRLEPTNNGGSVFIGENAGLNDDLSANHNIFIGYLSGKLNTTGYDNTFIGQNSGAQNVDGYNNTFIGRSSGYSNSDGHSNIFLGEGSGYSNVSGYGNVFIGRSSGYFETGNDKLYIENSNSASPLIYGDFSSDILQVNGTLEFATGTSVYEFSIDGTLADDSDDAVPTEKAVKTYVDNEISSLAFDEIIDVDSDTKIQVEETADDDIIRLDIAGTEKWVFTQSRLEPTNNGGSVFIGENAGLNDDLSANHNIFIGYLSGKSNTTGYDNTFIGQNSGTQNLDGYNNTFIGRSSGYSNSDGHSNIFLGEGSGYSNVSGYGNVFIGRSSGYFETGNDKLYIENSNSATPLIYGDFNSDLLKVNGTLEFTAGTSINEFSTDVTLSGDSDDAVPTEKAVKAYIENSIANIDELADSDNDTKIQVEESADEDIIRLDIAGTEKWVITGSRIEPSNSGGSLFIGEGAGNSDDLSSNYNSFIGRDAGFSTITGYYNTALSGDALKDNITGYENTALGQGALKSNVANYSSTAVGYYAMYYANNTSSGVETYNTAVGKDALRGSSTPASNTGVDNTAIGAYSMQNNTSGTSCTAIGSNSLISNSTGERNISVGGSSGYCNTSGSNNTILGKDANFYNQTGNDNVIIGCRAGQGTTYHSKTGNIFIGYESGYNETGSNKLYIENSNSASPLIYGDFSSDMLKVNGTLEFPSGTSINEFSTDATMADDSDDAVPTEKAVKAYVDNSILWTENSGSVYRGSGYVGIGTSSPNSNLSIYAIANEDVELELNSNQSNYMSRLKLVNPASSVGGSGNEILFVEGNGDGSSGNSFYGFHHSSNSEWFKLRTKDSGGSYLDVFQVKEGSADFIVPSGNVGIGTSSPQRVLHINDVMRLEPRATAPSSPSEGDIYMDSSTHKLRVYDGTSWQDCW